MRLAEKKDPVASVEYWKELHKNLHATYGQYVKWSDIKTRTITGYEEGLFAWLTVRESKGLQNTSFGVAEMGGASAQLAFPCPGCQDSRTIVLGGQKVDFFAQSYLGLGAKELRRTLGFDNRIPKKCRWGVGERRGWEKQQCVDEIDRTLPTFTIPDHKHLAKWYLVGNSFLHMDAGINGDVHSCCEHRREKNSGCYDKENSCLLAVYKPMFLKRAEIKYEDKDKVKKANINWTMGAAICTMTACLEKKVAQSLKCAWLSQSTCLTPPVQPKP